MKKPTIVILALFIIISCQEESFRKGEITLGDADYIIFGHYYGECWGEECVETFKLTRRNLFEDSNDNYPSGTAPLDFKLLDDWQFEKVKALPKIIPTELLMTEETVIGMPDGGDWGGIYFEITKDGQTKYWYIDKMESNLPEFAKPFVKQVGQYIELINN